jgi:hypothetical protein
MEPYLEGDPRDMFDAWHEDLRRRFEERLTFAEIRKGAQALADLYTRRRGRIGEAALDGEGKRAAFALYYAPLHFLTVWHVVREIGFDQIALRRVWDLGCGTGAAGAAWGAAFLESDVEAEPPAVLGLDRSGFALELAESAYEAFGLRGAARRVGLEELSLSPRAGRGVKRRPGKGSLPSIHPEDVILLAWTLNELDDEVRTRFLSELAGEGGRPLLVLEPVARQIAPWWSRWESALGAQAFAFHSFEFRKRLELPEWIASMDKAAGLDHGELTARVLGVLG